MSTPILADVNEQSSARIEGLQLTDELGDALAGASLGTFTLTLYDRLTGAIINGRDHVDIKGSGSGANDVTIDTQGTVIWSMRSADNLIVSADRPAWEEHIVLFEWTWASNPVKRGSAEYIVRVTRVDKLS